MDLSCGCLGMVVLQTTVCSCAPGVICMHAVGSLLALQQCCKGLEQGAWCGMPTTSMWRSPMPSWALGWPVVKSLWELCGRPYNQQGCVLGLSIQHHPSTLPQRKFPWVLLWFQCPGGISWTEAGTPASVYLMNTNKAFLHGYSLSEPICFLLPYITLAWFVPLFCCLSPGWVSSCLSLPCQLREMQHGVPSLPCVQEACSTAGLGSQASVSLSCRNSHK